MWIRLEPLSFPVVGIAIDRKNISRIKKKRKEKKHTWGSRMQCVLKPQPFHSVVVVVVIVAAVVVVVVVVVFVVVFVVAPMVVAVMVVVILTYNATMGDNGQRYPLLARYVTSKFDISRVLN